MRFFVWIFLEFLEHCIYEFIYFSPIGVVPGQQNSPQPQFIIQPHMPMAAVQTVGAGGQGTPGGAPGGQMQPGPGPQ